jgi:WD40 repeat protein
MSRLPRAPTTLTTISGHSDLKDKYLAVTNLHSGIDVYTIPTMQLVKSCSHNILRNYILQVSFVDNGWLVSGGDDGFARLYDLRSGQFLEKLDHSHGN